MHRIASEWVTSMEMVITCRLLPMTQGCSKQIWLYKLTELKLLCVGFQWQPRTLRILID